MAAPAKSLAEEKSPYAVNKALFSESTKIKDQMELVEKRLQKMEEHRTDVSDSVYLKVKTDYQTQLEEVRYSFQEKCREIEQELQQLYQAQEEQQSTLARHEEVLEEAKFRRTLGEFSEKKFKETETEENKEIKKYNEILGVIKGSIQQYEEILGHSFTPGSIPEEPVPEELLASQIAEEPVPEPEKEVEHTPATLPKTKAKAKSQPPSIFQEEPKKKAATSKEGTDSQLDVELDSFLQTEGDYFNSENQAATAGAGDEKDSTDSVELPEEPASPVSNPPPVSTTKPDDDSISNILRDIPLEEVTTEPDNLDGEEATGQGEGPTGSHVDIAANVAQEASLLLLEGDLDETEYILSENTSIGRSPSNDVVLKESKVSRQHATINYRDGNYILVDLKSSNGVLVNNKKVEEATLKDGDELIVGSFKFQFNIL